MINYNEQHIHLIVDGLKAADMAEGSTVDAHRMVAVGIHRLLGALNGKTSALRAEIKARIESLGPGDLHNDYATRLCGREGDPKSQKAATNLRLAYLWMAEFPEQVDWVFLNTGACQPTSMHVSWKNHQSAIIKEGREAGSPPGTIASRLLGTTPEVVKEVIDRAEKAEEKRKEKEQAQPEPTPEPAQAMDIKAVIAGLDMTTLAEALAQRPDAKLIADAMFQFAEMQAKAAKTKATKVAEEEPAGHQMKEAEWVWNLSDAELTERMQSNPHRVIDFAVFRYGDPEVPVLTGRWIKSSKTLSVTTFDGRREEVPHDIKTKISSRQLKIALGRYIGSGPGTFNGTDKHCHALTLERL